MLLSLPTRIFISNSCFVPSRLIVARYTKPSASQMGVSTKRKTIKLGIGAIINLESFNQFRMVVACRYIGSGL